MGAWELLGEVITTQTEQALTVSGLNITKDDLIYVDVDVRNPSGGVRSYYLTPNALAISDSTGQAQRIATNFAGFTTVNSFIEAADNTARMQTNVYFKIGENNKVVGTYESNRGFGGFVHIALGHFVSVVDVPTVSSLTVSSNNSNAFAANSRVSIYRLKAQKVADVILTQEAGSLTIAGLNIEKDSEYMMISQIFEAQDFVGAGNNYKLGATTPEANYPDTDWITQQMFFNNGVGINRYVGGNFAGLGAVSRGTNTTSFTMTRVFVGEDDRIRFQHFNVFNTLQTQSPFLQLFSRSSPGLTMSKIEALTVFTDARLLGVNSRFELYKLY
jgi:hypothetical protein